MVKKSKIQWCEYSWNPWHGCKKVSPGCKFCYMYRDKERYGQDPTTVLKSKSGFNKPLKLKEPSIIFTCSWSDFFIKEADQWRDEAWKIIKDTPQHIYQILTKRPERIADNLPADWGKGYPNVMLGVSIEGHNEVDRIRELSCLKIKAGEYTFKTFLSIEPLLAPVYLTDEYTSMDYIDWIIVGGESGNDTGKYRYRICDPLWIEDIIIDTGILDIPVFVKQMGTHIAKQWGLKDRHGGDIDEWPEEYQVRELPEILKNYKL